MNIAAENHVKFEFGRHETFAIREGWFPKGLAKLASGEFRTDLMTADALGLGSRMIKSLGYWLVAAGLADVSGRGNVRSIEPSNLGRSILKHDQWLEFPVTWWLIHLLIARREGSVWNWFFNDFIERVFDRATCVEAFLNNVRERAINPTTNAVAQRDVACLLISFAMISGHERPGPEDATTCPLRTLFLVVKHADTGRFEKTRPLDLPPVEAFLAAVSMIADDVESDSVDFSDLLRLRNSPGRLFGLDGDSIDELATAAASAYRFKGVGISMLGATRHLTVPRLKPSEWLDRHFARIGAAR